jgi:uncharacterized protein YbjQ (UPF0145 family)
MVTIALGIMITTAQRIPRRTVREYLGLVSGEALDNLQYPRGHSIGEFGSLEERFAGDGAVQWVLREMAQRASELGATVVIGVDIDRVAIGHGALLVSATGTAARL